MDGYWALLKVLSVGTFGGLDAFDSTDSIVNNKIALKFRDIIAFYFYAVNSVLFLKKIVSRYLGELIRLPLDS